MARSKQSKIALILAAVLGTGIFFNLTTLTMMMSNCSLQGTSANIVIDSTPPVNTENNTIAEIFKGEGLVAQNSLQSAGTSEEQPDHQKTQKITIAYPKCTTNPYETSIKESFDDVLQTAQDWLNHLPAYESIAERTIYTQHGHLRFFPFESMASCTNLQCVGGQCSQDRSKYACGISQLSGGEVESNCIIYSVGSNNVWEFEMDLLQRTNCHIHTFDCSGPKSRFNVPNDTRLHFHHLCLGATFAKGGGSDSPSCQGKKQLCGDTWTLHEIQQHLGHTKIDLLKLDIEGWEWPIFDIESTNATMPMQILIEVHYTWGRKGTRGVIHEHTMGSARDLVRLQSQLLKMGLVTIHRDDNKSCPWCTELTLLRVAC